MEHRRFPRSAVLSLLLLLLVALLLATSAASAAKSTLQLSSKKASSSPLRLAKRGEEDDGSIFGDLGHASHRHRRDDTASQQTCVPPVYNTTSKRVPGMLNVHLVPHTHDDAGWLKTVDQYLYALNQTIQVAGVSVLLDAVVAALADNPDRTFSYGEIAFFSRWWREASAAQRETVRSLVLGGDGGGAGRDANGRRARRATTAPKQLSFVNGGWVQHDEACAFWEDMVDQTSRGHSWLADAFADLSVIPTVGWQIDPFGHSATHADLLVAGAGMDAVFFGRADAQDLGLRAREGDLEVVWEGGDSGGKSGEGGDSGDDEDDEDEPSVSSRGVLAGTFASGNYGPPPGFNWDWGQGDDPIVDSTCGGPATNNVAEKVDAFVAAARALAKTVVGGGAGGGGSSEEGGEDGGETGDVMMTMGSDFQYANAAWWFRNLDRLVHHVNLDGRVNVFYSSPQAYVAAKARGAAVEGKGGNDDDADDADDDPSSSSSSSSPPPTALAFKVKRDDFFPYSDCDSCFWTGYFASRPALKLDVRRSGALLAAAKQLAALDSLLSGSSADEQQQWAAALDELEEAAALGQHHDAVTGTSQQHVACDYAARLARVRAAVEGLVAGAVARRAAAGKVGAAAPPAPPAPPSPPPPPLRSCPGTNASLCDVSVVASREGRPFRVAVYNPLARERAVRLRVPVSVAAAGAADNDSDDDDTPPTSSSAAAWTVVAEADGAAVPSQVVPLSRGARRARDSAVAAAGGAAAAEAAGDAHLAFVTPLLPPLGAATFLVSPAAPGSPGASFSSIVVLQEEQEEGGEVSKGSPPPRPRHPDFLLTPTEDPDGSAGGGQRANNTAALVLDGASLQPTSLLTRGSALPVRFWAAWYNASDGSAAKGSAAGAPGASPSGAYIFRPTPPDVESGSAAATSSSSSSSAAAQPPRGYRRVFRDAVIGPVLAEARQDFVDDFDGGGDDENGDGGNCKGSGCPPPPPPPQPRGGGSASVDVAVWSGSADAHVSWSAGPLPSSPHKSGGTEVVIVYSSPLQTSGELLTDSNGRRLLRRRRDARPTWALNVTEPVAGNFYPVTALASLEEEEGENDGKVEDVPSRALSSLSVVVDRAQGAASLVDGEVQLLAHRRLFFDDFRGVTEPLNETACGCRGCGCGGLVVAGDHAVVAARGGDEAAVARRLAAGLAGRPAVVLFGEVGEGEGEVAAKKKTKTATEEQGAPPPRPSFSSSIPALPPSLHLLTLAPAPRPAPEGALLLRIAHSFGASEKSKKKGKRKKLEKGDASLSPSSSSDDGEGDDFAAPVSLDLNALIPGVRWRAALETTVSGVKPLSDVQRVSWSVSGPLGGGGSTTKKTTQKKKMKTKRATQQQQQEQPLECSEGCADEELWVTLGPLQVRTWLVLPEEEEAAGRKAAVEAA